MTPLPISPSEPVTKIITTPSGNRCTLTTRIGTEPMDWNLVEGLLVSIIVEHIRAEMEKESETRD